MKPAGSTVPPKGGRPLSFDRAEALHAAMLLFWRHGFEATSISALTKTMGITPPSLYAAFGDKKRLFLEAVRLYLSGSPPEQLVRSAATARDAAWALLTSAATGYTGETTPRGCLLASSAIACSLQAEDIQDELAEIRRRTERELRNVIMAAIRSGELLPETDPDGLAGAVMAVIQGMSTLARDGASRDKLLRVASYAMAGWPAATRAGEARRDPVVDEPA